VPEEKAREAAEELAAYENCFVKIAQDLAVIKWMLGVTLAGVPSLVVSFASLVIKTFA